jgi:hypothetical protein
MNPSSLKPAPFGTRFGAYAIDVLAYLLVAFVADSWLKQAYPGMEERLENLTNEFAEMGGRVDFMDFYRQLMESQGSYLYYTALLSGLLMAAFFFLPEALWGLSLGKRTLGLQIVNRTDGSRKGLLKRSLIKNLRECIALVVMVPLLLAGATLLTLVLGALVGIWSFVLLIFMLMATGQSGLTPYDRWTNTGVYRKRDLLAQETNSDTL